MATFKGNTSGGQEIAKEQQAADAPFLSAPFWKEGVKVAVCVLLAHKSTNGPYVSARLMGPEEAEEIFKKDFPDLVLSELPETLEINGEEVSCVRIGNLAGITLARLEALAEAKHKYFAVGDRLYLECTGITPPEKAGHSSSPNFKLLIDRPEVPF
jgi:hypothetical protein